MKKILLVITIITSIFSLFSKIYAQANQVVNNGTIVTSENFPTGNGCVYNWVNDKPGIGLPASGKGNISPFTAINTTANPIIATIKAVPISSGLAYVANQGSNDVSVINIATNTTLAVIPVGSGAQGLAISPDGTKVYVTNTLDGTVSIIDGTINSVTAIIKVGTYPLGISVSPNNTWVYVANERSNTVSVINSESNSITATIPVNSRPQGIVISPDGNWLYVANFGSDNISVINTANNKITATIHVGTNPFGIATSPTGNRIYVSNANSHSISVIDPVSNTISNTIIVGQTPAGLAVSPDGTKLYVANKLSATVSVINTISNAVTATVQTDPTPYNIAFSSDGNLAYVTNTLSDKLSAINTTTLAVTNQISVGKSPTALGNYITKVTGCPPATFNIQVNPTPPSSITANSNLSPLQTFYGTASPAATFNVSAANLVDGILVTSPPGFEVSLDNVNFSNTVIVNGDSNNALLSNIKLNPDVIRMPASGNSNYNYSTNVDYAVSTMQITPTAINANSNIKVNGITVNNGSASLPIALNIGQNSINITVTSPDGLTSKTYTITVNRSGSSDATLSNLSVNRGALSPMFSANRAAYSILVENAITTISVTPTLSNLNASVKVNGVKLASGSASANIEVPGNNTMISIVITAQDGSTIKTYTVSVSKTGDNTSANLNGLSLNTSFTQTATTGTGDGNYLMTIANNINMVKLTAIAQNPNATILINGKISPSGIPSDDIQVGTVPIVVTVKVTSVNGAAVKTYIVTIKRVVSNNAFLSKISLNATYIQTTASGPEDENYIMTVPYNTASVKLTPTAQNVNAIIKINGAVVVSASPSGSIPISSTEGATAIIEVTAQDGITIRKYNIKIVQGLSNSVLSTTLVNPSFNLIPVYIRLTSITPVGKYAGKTVLTSTNAATTNIAMVNSTVKPVPITIRTTNVSKTYGTVLTSISNSQTFTITDGVLQNGNTITAVRITYGLGSAIKASGGTYSGSVIISGATGGNSFLSSNYAINYLAADINVLPVGLTVTANNQIKDFGTDNPMLSLTYNGFVNGETVTDLASPPFASTTTLKRSPIGRYPILVGDAISPNYTFTYIPGTLTVSADHIALGIPNTITPNADGINDVWNIKNLDAYPDATVDIFDRYGRKVFSSIGYGVAWDGSYQGAILPTGTYYYIVNPKNNAKTVAGCISVIR